MICDACTTSADTWEEDTQRCVIVLSMEHPMEHSMLLSMQHSVEHSMEHSMQRSMEHSIGPAARAATCVHSQPRILCTDMCMDMCTHMCTHVHHKRTDMCICMCIHVGSRKYKVTDGTVRMSVWRQVYGHGLNVCADNSIWPYIRTIH